MVDADLGLAYGDLRAAERTFQLLSPGDRPRRPRRAAPAAALLQTYDPAHPVIRRIVSGDREAFYAREIEARRARRPAALRPPRRDRRLAAPDRASAHGHAARFAAPRRPSDAIMVLGPAEAPLAVIRGRHRFRLLVQAPRSADLQGYIRAWLAAAPPRAGGVRVQVDIDPQTFL